MADDRMKVTSQQAALVFADLLDSLIVDVASEAHRAAKLGFDYKLNVEEEEEVRLAAHARAVVGDSGAIGTENGNKHTIDVFGQTHPTIANEMFECLNCSRPIVAGRFAPHLEKCMGKGRKARLKANRNMTTTQQRRARSSPISAYGGIGSTTTTATRTPNRTPTRTPEESQRVPAETNDGTSEESHDDDEKDSPYDLPHPGKTRRKMISGRGWKSHLGSVTQLSTSRLVPVPLHLSNPGGASTVALYGTLLGSAPIGSVAGMAVEVAVEQFHFATGRVSTCGDMELAKDRKKFSGHSHGKGRRGGEKKKHMKKHMGQVLARSPFIKYIGAYERDEMDIIEENDNVTRVQNRANEFDQGSYLQDGQSVEVKNDASSDLLGSRVGPCLTGSSVENYTTDKLRKVSANLRKSVASRVEISREQSISRVGVAISSGLKSPLHGDGDYGATEEKFDFGKRKKGSQVHFKAQLASGLW